MIRFLLIILLILITAAAGFWFSAKTLPSWYADGVGDQTHANTELAKRIETQGFGRFLGSKISEVLNGQLLLDEPEFNALVLHSLKRSKEGRQLLEVTDAIHIDLSDDGVELGMIVNLQKVANADARAKRAINKALEAIPFAQSDKLALSIFGVPVARNGNIGFSENFTVSLGAIPLSSDLLRSFGVKTERVAQESLAIRNLRVNSIDTLDQQILLGVTPRF